MPANSHSRMDTAKSLPLNLKSLEGPKVYGPVPEFFHDPLKEEIEYKVKAVANQCRPIAIHAG